MKGTFNTEAFKKTLLSYLITLSVTWGILILSGFGLPLILETIPHSRLAIGEVVSGVIAIGFVAIGSLPIGMVSNGIVSVGIFAVGGTACGIIAVGMNSIGVVAIGYNAVGIYALSYKSTNKGRYIFSPERQDAKAVALFTHWMPKLKGAFATES
jgi:hypothetical protein